MSFNELHVHLMDRKYHLIPNFLQSSEDHAQMASVTFYKDYPLVVAIKQEAPESVILALVQAYPEAIFYTSKQNEFPYEIATRLLYPKIILDVLRGKEEDDCGFRGRKEQDMKKKLQRLDSHYSCSTGEETEDSERCVDRRIMHSKTKTVSFSRSTSHHGLNQQSKGMDHDMKSLRSLQSSSFKTSRGLREKRSLKRSATIV